MNSVAHSVLEVSECEHCESFSIKKLCSRLSLLSRDLGQSSVPCASGSAAAEARRKLRLWGLKMELSEKFEKDTDLSHS